MVGSKKLWKKTCTLQLQGTIYIFGMISAMEYGTLNLETQQTELAKYKAQFVGVQ